MSENEGEDEVNTKKEPVRAKETKKKKAEAKKNKKKTSKKVTKKEKPNKKKKAIIPKSIVEDVKKNAKDGKVKLPLILRSETEGLFGVARCRITFQAKKKGYETDLPTYIVIDQKKLVWKSSVLFFFSIIKKKQYILSRSINILQPSKSDGVINSEKNKLDEDLTKKPLPPFEEKEDIVDMNKDETASLPLCKKVYR